jgi:DNA-damage-inducible protein J
MKERIIMTTARISVNIDGEVKRNAQKILNEIGMDLTTAIDLMLRTIIREEKIPFNLETNKSFREANHKKIYPDGIGKS